MAGAGSAEPGSAAPDLGSPESDASSGEKPGEVAKVAGVSDPGYN